MPQPAAADATTGDAANAAAPAASGRTADARLEIVPPGASNAQRAGTQSGIQAGGEGEMLRQELQQTKETLAAREAEAAEMKARIDELEKLQAQQQQLISMKDSELAAAQKRLADSNKAEAKQQAATDAGMGPTPWLLGGAALLLAMLTVTLVAALAAMVIGYVGLFFARMIKAVAAFGHAKNSSNSGDFCPLSAPQQMVCPHIKTRG